MDETENLDLQNFLSQQKQLLSVIGGIQPPLHEDIQWPFPGPSSSQEDTDSPLSQNALPSMVPWQYMLYKVT